MRSYRRRGAGGQGRSWGDREGRCGLADASPLSNEAPRRKAMVRSIALILLPLMAVPALGQTASEHHVWQDNRQFVALSRTAEAITGSIELSGGIELAVPGSKTTLTFANGSAIRLTSVEASWRVWSLDGVTKHTAETFKLSQDPGVLENGNFLCGANSPARYVVFYEEDKFGPVPTLTMAVFSSRKSPTAISSPNLCGIYTYSIE